MDKPELIYVYDPVCGWCYGFTPVMKQIKELYGDTLTYSVYTGGLVLGDRVGTVNDNFEFVKESYKKVEEYSGVRFGEGFKENYLTGKYKFDSYPPGKAFVILKELAPAYALEIAHDLQNLINYDGKDVYPAENYTPIAQKYGIDTGIFAQRFADTAYDGLLRKDFETAAYYQAQGYPHVLIRKGEQYYLLCRGYQGFDQLKPVIDTLLADEK